jgi:hypothetical protein
LAQQAGTTPPWLAPLNRKTLRDRGKLETIQLRSGRATMLEEDSDHRITIVWMVPDRAYLLSGSISRDLAIAAANAIE